MALKYLTRAEAPDTASCKVCGSSAKLKFGLPHNKRANHPIPEEPDDCWYYQCDNCNFLFTPALDEGDHTEIYDETYWNNQDPDWYGRVTETFRLVALANEMLGKRLDEVEILDFGCGIGGFLDMSHRSPGAQDLGYRHHSAESQPGLVPQGYR